MKRSNISSIYQNNNVELEPSAKIQANRVSTADMSDQFRLNENGVYTITVSKNMRPHVIVPTYKVHSIIITNPERDFYLESLKIVAKTVNRQSPSVLIHLDTDNLIRQTYKNEICYTIPEQYNIPINLSNADYSIFEIQLVTSGTFTICYCEAVIPSRISSNSTSIINPKNISSDNFLSDSSVIYSLALPQKFNDIKFTISINGEIFTENDFRSMDELNRRCLILVSKSELERIESSSIVPIQRYNISISPANISSMYLVANKLNCVVYIYGSVVPRFLVN